MTERRTVRRSRAKNLRVSVYDRGRNNLLGDLTGADWFEDWTQIRGRSDDPWQDTSANVQLAGNISPELQRNMPFTEFEFYVVLSHAGQTYSGNVMVEDQRGAQAVFHVQGGFEQER